jgi:hypothetical protein
MVDKELPEVDALEGYESTERDIRRDARRRRVIIAAAAAAVVLAGATTVVVYRAGTSQPEPSKKPRLEVTSTLDGLGALPHRILWRPFPKPRAGIRRLDYFIDGKKDWVEHFVPYNYGPTNGPIHGYLVTSFLQPGTHTFTVKVFGPQGRTATDSVTATVSQAPAPPAELQGTWKGAHGYSTLVVSPAGWHMSVAKGGPWVDVVYPASGIAEVQGWMAVGKFKPVDPGTPPGFLCDRKLGGPARYRWTVTGQHLRLRLVSGHPCHGLAAFLAAPWTKKP